VPRCVGALLGEGSTTVVYTVVWRNSWVDDHGEKRRYDWSENAFLVSAQYEFTAYGFL